MRVMLVKRSDQFVNAPGFKEGLQPEPVPPERGLAFPPFLAAHSASPARKIAQAVVESGQGTSQQGTFEAAHL